jgi:hypothetical protein
MTHILARPTRRERLWSAGKTVVGVLSGGNLDLRELARIVAEPAEEVRIGRTAKGG